MSSVSFLTISAVCALALGLATSANKCTKYTHEDNENHTMPYFSSYIQDEYQTEVEVFLINYNKIEFIQEWYKKDRNTQRNRGSTLLHSGDRLYKYYYFTDPMTTSVKDLRTGSCNLTDPQNPPYSSYGWVYSDERNYAFGPTALLMAADHVNKKYMGPTTFRDIPAQRWQACDQGVVIDYYFTASTDWRLPYAPDNTIWPLGITVQGDKSQPGMYGKNNHNYQYIYGSLSPALVSPKNLLTGGFGSCDGINSYEAKTRPELPDVLSFDFRVINEVFTSWDMRSTTSFSGRLEYDGHLKVLRMDARNIFTEEHRKPSPLKVVLDYNSGAAFYIDQKTGTCKMEAIPSDMESAGNSEHFGNLHGFYAILIDPTRALKVDSSFSYVGNVSTRGISSDFWISNKPETMHTLNNGQVAGSIEYYLAGDVVKDVQGHSMEGSPVRMDIYYGEVSEIKKVYVSNHFDFYGFQGLTTVEHELFNVEECFDTARSDIMLVYFSTNTVGVFAVDEDPVTFEHALFTYVINETGMSPVRVSDIEVDSYSTADGDYVSAYLEVLPSVPGLYLFQKMPPSFPGAKELVTLNVQKLEDCAQTCLDSRGSSGPDCMSFHYCGTDCYINPTNDTYGSPEGDHVCDRYVRDADRNVVEDPSFKDIVRTLIKRIVSHKFELCIQHCDPGDQYRVAFTAEELLEVSSVRDSSKLDEFTKTKDGYKLANPDFKIKQMSLGECADICSGGLEGDCEVFSYCGSRTVCMVTSEPRSNVTSADLQPDSACNTYTRSYIANYVDVPGSIANTKYETQYVDVLAPEDCAKLCTEETKYRCESFDYCPVTANCDLHKDNFLQPADPTDVTNDTVPGCFHFARAEGQPYDVTFRAEILTGNTVVIPNAGFVTCSEQCQSSSDCAAFSMCVQCDKSAAESDVCADFADEGKIYCILTDDSNIKHVANNSHCNLYVAAGKKPSPREGTTVTAQGYSAGAMAGLAFGMIVLGMLLVFGAIYLAQHLRPQVVPSSISVPVTNTFSRLKRDDDLVPLDSTD